MMTLIQLSTSFEVKEVLKFIACTASPERIWAKLTHTYYWEIQKNWL